MTRRPLPESARLERALQSLRIIHTWASVDAKRLVVTESREHAMRQIANKAAEGLGREDLRTDK